MKSVTHRAITLLAAFGLLAASGCGGEAAVGPAGNTLPAIDVPEQIDCVGVFVEYDADYTWSAGPPTFELITKPRAGFELSSPADHAGRIVGILVGDGFDGLPGLSARRDLGKTYYFTLSENFLTGEHLVIDRKEVTNFRVAR